MSMPTDRDYEALRFRNLKRFARGLAHDFKSPLNTVVINLELLRRRLEADATDAADAERSRRWFGAIERAVARLDDAVNALREQLAPWPEAATAVDLKALLTALEQRATTQARLQGVTLNVRLPPEPVVVRGMAAPLLEALLAMLGRALDLTPAAGRLTIELEPAGAGARVLLRQDDPAEAPARPDQDSADLAVACTLIQAQGGAVEADVDGGAGFRIRLAPPP